MDWSPGAINSLFNLQDFPHAVFNEMLIAPSNEKLNAAVREVGIDGDHWQLSRMGARIFQSAYLKSEANTWLVFVK